MRDEFSGANVDRLEAIRSLGIMDSEDEADFDEIAAYASEICEAPVSLVTLVDDERQWAKAVHGTQQRDYTLSESICAHGLDGTDFLEIEDTLTDPRTKDNPLVQGPSKIRYYGGAILKLGDTTPIGALCILDTKPRRLPEATKKLLKLLARQVTRRLELRRALAAQELLANEIDHRVKNSLQMVTALVRIQRSQARSDDTKAALGETINRLSAISMLHAELHKASSRNEIALGRFLEDIVTHLRPTLPDEVALESRLVPMTVPSQTAASLAMIVNEAVANAAKHAFPDGRAGRITIELSVTGNVARLIITDDGIGSASSRVCEPSGSSGLGRQIIDASAQRIEGEVHRTSGPEGTRIEIEFPAAPPVGRPV